MIAERTVREQLKNIGLKFRFLGRSEVKRLSSVLRSDEEIHHCIYGYHSDTPVLFVATDQRLLIVDKRFLFLQQQTIQYDEITHLHMGKGLLAATFNIKTKWKRIEFKTYADARLKRLYEYTSELQEQYKQRAHMNYIELDVHDWTAPFGLTGSIEYDSTVV